jgi:hypothetical protein
LGWKQQDNCRSDDSHAHPLSRALFPQPSPPSCALMSSFSLQPMAASFDWVVLKLLHSCLARNREQQCRCRFPADSSKPLLPLCVKPLVVNCDVLKGSLASDTGRLGKSYWHVRRRRGFLWSLPSEECSETLDHWRELKSRIYI